MQDPNGNQITLSEHGLESLLFEKLREKFEHSGEAEFRKNYPCPFLLVCGAPNLKIEWGGLRTMEASNSDMLLQSNSTDSPRLVVPLRKSSRNLFVSQVTVGRSSNNDIVIRSPKVSKLHSAFVQENGDGYHLVDMGSLNGTVVNGRRLSRQESVRLKIGDKLAIWRFVFEYCDLDNFVLKLKSP